MIGESARERLMYKGLRIKAAGNLHELAADAIASLGLPFESRVLDLGAGEGAGCARLRDLGFARIEAAEVDVSRFAVPGIPCRFVDLNAQDFASALDGQYDVILALEVVEHLENPWSFFRNVAQRLRIGGYLLVSTPNVTSAYSRLRFLREGELQWFGCERLTTDGHTTPIFEWQVDAMANRSGMEVVARYHTDDRLLREKYVYARGRVRTIFSRWFYLYQIARILMRGAVEGEVRLWILRRQHG